MVFSLPPGTSRDGYKARYRELAKALHPDKAKSKSAEEAFKVVTEAFRAVMAGGASGDPNRATAHPTARNASGGDARRPFWQVHRDEAAAPPPKWSCRASTTAGRAPEPASTSAPRWTDGSSGGWGDDPAPVRPRVLPVVLGPGGKRGWRSAGGGGGGARGREAYAAEGYDDVPRDEDYDPYAHGYAHGAGTREDPTTFDVDDGSFPGDDWDAVGDADVAGSNTTGEETRTTADDAAWFSRWNARSAAGGNGGGTSRWGQPTGRVEPSEVASRWGARALAAAATPTSTSTRTTPTRATRRTTICSRTIRASRSRRLHPRAIGSRASVPAVRRRRRRRGSGGWRIGGRYGGIRRGGCRAAPSMVRDCELRDW